MSYGARDWGSDGDQNRQVLYFHETDSLEGETDIKSMMCVSRGENPGRRSGREASIALRTLSSCVILGHLARPPRK